MARVGIEGARKRIRRDIRDVISCEPINNPIVQAAKSRTIFFGHDVFIERSDHDQHLIAARLKELHQSLKRIPLQ